MMEEKSEQNEDDRSTTVVTTGSALGPQVDHAMMDPITEAAASLNQKFVPHGILKLPQSIASSLASDFLNKRDIRDLGVTCRWMLDSLSGCIIREPVSLLSAVRRLKRQHLAHCAASTADDEETRTLRRLAARLPNLLIGRFSTAAVITSCLTQTDIYDLGQLSQLVDARRLILSVSWCASDLRYSISLLQLPPMLNDLVFQPGHNYEVLPLSHFILPKSLQRILWRKGDHFLRADDLSHVQWPQPSSLTSLVNIPHSGSMRRVRLPDGLLNVTFNLVRAAQIHGSPTITDITLPTSVTNLAIKWSDVNGRYRDLPFPPLLKRLVLGCEITKNDFNLPEWTHLPQSCVNLQLTFEEDIYHRHAWPNIDGSDSSTEVVIITLPKFVSQARILHASQCGFTSQRTRLCLTHATSLTSLETCTPIDQIDWPIDDSALNHATDGVGLSVIKFHGLVNEFISSTNFPTTVRILDLSQVLLATSWRDSTLLTEANQLIRLAANRLKRLKITHWFDSPPIRQMVRSWSRTALDCLIEYGIQPRDTITRGDLNLHFLSRISFYLNGDVVQPSRKCTPIQAKEWTNERGLYDVTPSED